MEHSDILTVEAFDYRSYLTSFEEKLKSKDQATPEDVIEGVHCLSNLLEADNWYHIVNDIKIIDPEEEEEQRTVEEIRRAKEKREAQQREQLGIKDADFIKPEPPPTLPVVPQRKFTDILTEIEREFQQFDFCHNEFYKKISFEINLASIIIQQLLGNNIGLDFILKYLLEVDNFNILATKHAAILYGKLKQFDQAIAMYTRLLLISGDPTTHYKIGDLLFEQNQLKLAIAYYTQATELLPKNNKAMCRLEKARKAYIVKKVSNTKIIQKLKVTNYKIKRPTVNPSTLRNKDRTDSAALTEFLEKLKAEAASTEQSVDSQPLQPKQTLNRFKKLEKKKKLNIKKKKIEDIIKLEVSPNAFHFVNKLTLDEYPIRMIEEKTPFFEYMSTSDPNEDFKSCTPFCCGQRVSLYPWLPGHSTSEGGPVTDSFGISYNKNLIISAIADGSSWGDSARQAASKAVEGFIKELNGSGKLIENISQVPKLLLQAVASAHNFILKSDEDGKFNLGTSTLLGGVLLPQSTNLGNWSFICASVGDCKAFHYSYASKKVVEITAGCQDNRDDPGGAIGAVDISQIQPDLRNLRLFSQPCSDRDIIFMVSDGVHDNFNPKYLGIRPSELKLNCKDWANVKESDCSKAVSPFILHSMEDKINQIASNLTPHLCTHALLNNALETTQKSRTFMEQNPTKKLPDNYSVYPGQLDHASCLSFVVGMFSPPHMSLFDLWDYHGSIEENSHRARSDVDASTQPAAPVTHPISHNYPLSIMVSEVESGVLIACRTLARCTLRVTADCTHVFLKVVRPSTLIDVVSSAKLASLSKYSNEMLHPAERTIHLPIQIDPTSQNVEYNENSGLYIIRFGRKKNLARE